MNTRTAYLGMAILLAVSQVFCHADILIDFGRNDNQTTVAGGLTYNNVTGSGTDLETASVDLVDMTNAATGLTWNTSFENGGSFAGAGADYAGPYPGSVSSFAASALQDSLFVRNTIVDGDASPTTGTRTVFSLVAAAGFTYDIEIYGARGNNGGADTHFFVTDASGTQSQSFDVFNNSTNVASFAGLAPTGGAIDIVFTTDGSTMGDAPRGAINFARITVNPIPEPTTTGLLGFAAITCVVRRRR